MAEPRTHELSAALGSSASAQAGVQRRRRRAEKREMRLAGVLAAGLIFAVAAAQSPTTAPRLIGEAAPPASLLRLWYRAPASDHPLLPLDAPRQARQAGTAEWVRALPVGNGRIG